MTLQILEVVFLLALVVLVVDDVFKHCLDFLDTAEQGHVVALGRGFLVLLLAHVEFALLSDAAVDEVRLSGLEHRLLLVLADTSV